MWPTLKRILVLLLAAGSPAMATEDVNWDYEGSQGPQKWGAITADFHACSHGMAQSPIDLTGSVMAQLANIEIHWKPVAWDVSNTGHTIELGGPDGGYAMIDGRRYELVQFHFHTPSEHTIDGNHMPMEAHFVHRAEDGTLAVIGVMMVPGTLNLLFRNIMALAPTKKGSSPFVQFDPRALLPAFSSVYRYQGSLTTPPCSEIVLWTVLHNPIEVDEHDILTFRGIHPMNARPVQPLNRRFLLSN